MLSQLVDEIKKSISYNIKKLYNKYKYLLLALIPIVLIITIFALEQRNPENVEEQTLYVLGISISNWLDWITIVTIPITAIWAIYQYNKSVKARQQEKATKIAKEFSKDLITKCSIVHAVFKNSSLNNMLKFDEKNFDSFKFFNVDELREIYKDDDFPTRYSDAFKKVSNELDEIYHLILIKSVTSDGEQETKEIKINVNIQNKKIKSIQETRKEINPFILQNKNLPFHFYDLVSDVLNQLEYICMDISSKATDSKFIYQSLHQMFLRTIRTLAAQIAVDNCNFSDKVYTNIIHVYNEWTRQYMKDLEIEKRKKEKINRILNPKIKVV